MSFPSFVQWLCSCRTILTTSLFSFTIVKYIIAISIKTIKVHFEKPKHYILCTKRGLQKCHRLQPWVEDTNICLRSFKINFTYILLNIRILDVICEISIPCLMIYILNNIDAYLNLDLFSNRCIASVPLLLF